MTNSTVIGWAALSLLVCAPVPAQTRSYPDEVRGYKVERAVVEMKKKPQPAKRADKPPAAGQSTNTPVQTSPQTSNQTNPPAAPQQANQTASSDVDQLITFGRPQLARVTPLGITFEVPIVVAPVKQSGHVDFLLFEDMMVNQHAVEIDEYHRAFDLPGKKPLKLPAPLSFYIYLPTMAVAALDEWSNSKETWPITGRVYVCGKFKKFLFTFKRCVPVELDLTIRNPLKGDEI
jgi:hypothetical protein